MILINPHPLYDETPAFIVTYSPALYLQSLPVHSYIYYARHYITCIKARVFALLICCLTTTQYKQSTHIITTSIYISSSKKVTPCSNCSIFYIFLILSTIINHKITILNCLTKWGLLEYVSSSIKILALLLESKGYRFKLNFLLLQYVVTSFITAIYIYNYQFGGFQPKIFLIY